MVIRSLEPAEPLPVRSPSRRLLWLGIATNLIIFAVLLTRDSYSTLNSYATDRKLFPSSTTDSVSNNGVIPGALISTKELASSVATAGEQGVQEISFRSSPLTVSGDVGGDADVARMLRNNRKKRNRRNALNAVVGTASPGAVTIKQVTTRSPNRKPGRRNGKKRKSAKAKGTKAKKSKKRRNGGKKLVKPGTNAPGQVLKIQAVPQSSSTGNIVVRW